MRRRALIIDLAKVEGLTGIEVGARSVVIGAMTRHMDVANSPALHEAMPGLAAVPASIGDPHVRNRGTIGGSIANNDPNADYPAACLGLGATIITTKRRIAADDFFTGMFETALEPDEIITKISFPIAKKSGYEKFKHPASGFALVGVFVSKRGPEIRVAVTGAGANGVFRVPAFEEALEETLLAEIARRPHHPAGWHERRHSRRQGVSRAPRRRDGPPRGREGGRQRLTCSRNGPCSMAGPVPAMLVSGLEPARPMH